MYVSLHCPVVSDSSACVLAGSCEVVPQGSEKPGFLKKSLTQWVFWGFGVLLGFFGQAGKNR